MIRRNVITKSKSRRSRGKLSAAMKRHASKLARVFSPETYKWRHENHHYQPKSPRAQFLRCAAAGAVSFTAGFAATRGVPDFFPPQNVAEGVSLYLSTVTTAMVPFLMTMERARYHWHRAMIATAAVGLVMGAGAGSQQNMPDPTPTHRIR